MLYGSLLALLRKLSFQVAACALCTPVKGYVVYCIY